MNATSPFVAIAAALAADGFEANLNIRGAVFRGSIIVNGFTLKISLRYSDLTLTEAPRTFIENPEILPRKVIPHLDDENELCVVDRDRFVVDRYSAPAEARGLVVKAARVIERGLTKHAIEEIAREFPQHWSMQGVSVAFGRYQGPLEQAADSGNFAIWLPSKKKKGSRSGFCVTTDSRLSFFENQKRPSSLGEVLEWASECDDKLPSKILHALGQCSPLPDPTCFIVAPNGTVGFELLLSKKGPSTAKALERPAAWQKILRLPLGKNLPIARKRGLRMDIDHVLGRNGNGTPPLWSKDIVLVGAGSIGGYLARALGQLGAGRGPSGRLTLIDDDVLKATNIGRHSLGTPEVGKLKVNALREQIEADFPGARVWSRNGLVQTQQLLLSQADLVIEATGERGVSELLNSLVIDARIRGSRYPAVLYTWIEGAGAAVQTFFGSDPEFGCLRCLHPDFVQPSRFSALKDEGNVELMGGCGEAFFMPYGPSAPMMAASLATQHIYDWVQGNARPVLRTVRLNLHQTREVKPSNPRRAASCPACSSHGN